MTMPPIRILLADDVPANQRAIGRLLKRRGCEVVSACNGQEAVDLFRAQPFDVVLLDVQMPVMDGHQAARSIREIDAGRSIPIIAMSARGSESDRHECLQSGMTTCLPKPVDVEELFKTIEAIRTGNPLASSPTTDSVATAPATAPVLDLADTMGRLMDDQVILKFVVDQFRDGAEPCIEAMESALRMKDLNELAQAAHRLRGIAANLGAKEVQQITANIERGTEAGRYETDDVLVSRLKTAVEKVRQELQRRQL
ncbi:response regulator [Stieleria sp. TO1_6]|uniref:response regulator n=1 Tax=Stieleria tagensis TaxID=2956795 RepID=UPI00209B158C|nr:hybrid sensor histidine kinase/response regulator [Stieleria tagensis]MCO8121702.1 response regulator [Stieleria tagensis]